MSHRNLIAAEEETIVLYMFLFRWHKEFYLGLIEGTNIMA